MPRPIRSFVVRIYSTGPTGPGQFTGTVQEGGAGTAIPFSDGAQLLAALRRPTKQRGPPG